MEELSIEQFKVKTGRKAPTDDKTKVRLANYLDIKKALPSYPGSSPSYGAGINFPMYGNDEHGDCTCAMVGHEIQTVSKVAGHPITPTLDNVMSFYYRTGQEEGLAPEDGRYIAGGNGVLDSWKKTGFPLPNSSLDKILGYAAIGQAQGNHDHLMLGHWLFGGLALGVNLPTAAYYQFNYGVQHGVRPVFNMSKTLPDGSHNPGSWQAGSWGGHAICTTVCGPRSVVIITWAMRAGMTWDWMDAYCDEVYVVLSPDFLNSDKSPVVAGGYDKTQLIQDLGEI